MDMPDAFPNLTFENVEDFLLELAEHDKMIKAGIALVGDASDYGLVWEWGNRRQKKAGPRTVKGTNPAGKMAWLSSQAPFGYIRINEPFMHHIVDTVMSKVEFNQPDAASMTRELERAAKKISKAIAEIVRDSAPVDSGLLRRSIVPVDPTDILLDEETDDIDTLEF